MARKPNEVRDDFGLKKYGARKDFKTNVMLLQDIADFKSTEKEFLRMLTRDNVWPTPVAKEDMTIQEKYMFLVERQTRRLLDKNMRFSPNPNFAEEDRMKLYKQAGMVYFTMLESMKEILKQSPQVAYDNATNWIDEGKKVYDEQKELRAYIESIHPHSNLGESDHMRVMWNMTTYDRQVILAGMRRVSHSIATTYNRSNNQDKYDMDDLQEFIRLKTDQQIEFLMDPATHPYINIHSIDAMFDTLLGKDKPKVEKTSKTDLSEEEQLKKEIIKQIKENIHQAFYPEIKNVTRFGINWRKGRDITQEEFEKTFDVGVEYGAALPNKKRIALLNMSYDALMDHALALGIKPSSIGKLSKTLNQYKKMGARREEKREQLTIALASRGRGSANAHFDPSIDLINLTNARGAGSLAHELGHAQDFMMNGKESVTKSLGANGLTVDIVRALSYEPMTRELAIEERRRMSNEWIDSVKDAIHAELVEKPLLEQRLDALMELYFQEKIAPKMRTFIDNYLNKDDPTAQLNAAKFLNLANRDYRTNSYSLHNSPEWDNFTHQRMMERVIDYRNTGIEEDIGKFKEFVLNDEVFKENATYFVGYNRSETLRSASYYLARKADAYAVEYALEKGMEFEIDSTKKVPTQFYKDAMTLDEGNVRNYFSTPQELLARAFETYVSMRLSDFTKSLPEEEVNKYKGQIKSTWAQEGLIDDNSPEMKAKIEERMKGDFVIHNAFLHKKESPSRGVVNYPYKVIKDGRLKLEFKKCCLYPMDEERAKLEDVFKEFSKELEKDPKTFLDYVEEFGLTYSHTLEVKQTNVMEFTKEEPDPTKELQQFKRDKMVQKVLSRRDELSEMARGITEVMKQEIPATNLRKERVIYRDQNGKIIGKEIYEFVKLREEENRLIKTEYQRLTREQNEKLEKKKKLDHNQMGFNFF